MTVQRTYKNIEKDLVSTDTIILKHKFYFKFCFECEKLPLWLSVGVSNHLVKYFRALWSLEWILIPKEALPRLSKSLIIIIFQFWTNKLIKNKL